MEKPSELFDREAEWGALTSFARRGRPGLGVVRGRRRHGKSVLVRALAGAAGLFYHQAIRGVPAEQRRDFARAFQAHFGGPLPAFHDWTEVIDALLGSAGDAPGRPVIIDELPYLTESSPELESVLQRAVDQAGDTAASLLLCGSATTVMTRLLVGSAPLRGRAQLEVDVRPFDFRQMAGFTGLPPEVAFPVHAAIGGVPGYAVDLLDRIFPASLEDVERWLVEVVASPRRPLVHEARAMLELEPGLREPATYLSVLGTLAHGATRTGEIASRLGRPSDQVAHALKVLAELGFADRIEDPLRRGRPSWTITDPLLRLYAAVLRPYWSEVEQGHAALLARRVAEPWRSQILGPHLEHLARVWTHIHAGEATVGGLPARVGRTTVADRKARRSHELDVVATDGDGRVLAIGEAKLRRVEGRDVERLEAIRALLPGQQPVRLLLFSATGFAAGLDRAGVELVGLERLAAGN